VAQFFDAQFTLSNRFLICGLSAAALPLACCQVAVWFGEVTVGVGDGVAAGVADPDEVADGVGVGLAFACAAVAAPSLLALWAASTAVPFPPWPRTFALVVAVEDG
jgi:hypothetical protein